MRALALEIKIGVCPLHKLRLAILLGLAGSWPAAGKSKVNEVRRPGGGQSE